MANPDTAIGPYIVTADEIKDPHKLQIRLTNNGVVMQNFNTDGMAHKIPRSIEWTTSIHTLHCRRHAPAQRAHGLVGHGDAPVFSERLLAAHLQDGTLRRARVEAVPGQRVYCASGLVL
jgi:hypothetical protein